MELDFVWKGNWWRDQVRGLGILPQFFYGVTGKLLALYSFILLDSRDRGENEENFLYLYEEIFIVNLVHLLYSYNVSV
ncbi:MAG: hypothetical protein K6C05_08630 [Anaerovibrio sp.]|uniref:hypothetical protein n=1 Tax=Anaerovibrio sp. TaxID=1872532 RepID=UPI0025FC25F1|nr:hypothetical protein [Anaerovibrio sp.]MCR5176902.1 hypothetical protein [Anaerovibrio sp.]